MLKVSGAFEIQKRYALGEREFKKVQLRRAELAGVNLSHADLANADLSYADLQGADLSYADLSECYLNEANLTEANLKGAKLASAHLVKASLIRANLANSDLHGASLTGSLLTRGNLSRADLTGAFLTGADLTGANLKGAQYNAKTCFDRGFNPVNAGMQEKVTISSTAKRKFTVEDLLKTLNALVKCSSKYLGNMMTARYFESSRPAFGWLNEFTIDSSGTVKFAGDTKAILTIMQIKWSQEWINKFIKKCSMIVQDFPNVVEQNHIPIVII